MLVLSVGDSVVAAACVGVPCAWVAVEPDPLIAIDFIHYMSSCFNRDGIPQAAEAAHKQYVWAVTVDHHDDAVLASLQDVVNGCLLPDPAARWTIPRVLDALTSLQRTVASGAGAYSAGTESSGIEVVARSPQVARPWKRGWRRLSQTRRYWNHSLLDRKSLSHFGVMTVMVVVYWWSPWC